LIQNQYVVVEEDRVEHRVEQLKVYLIQNQYVVVEEDRVEEDIAEDKYNNKDEDKVVHRDKIVDKVEDKVENKDIEKDIDFYLMM